MIFFNNKSISGEICNFKGPPCKWGDGWQSLTVLCIPQNAYIQPLESFKHFWTFIDPLKPFGHARTLTYLDSPQPGTVFSAQEQQRKKIKHGQSHTYAAWEFPFLSCSLQLEMFWPMTKSFPISSKCYQYLDRDRYQSMNVQSFSSHFHPDFWRELTNPLLFPRQNSSPAMWRLGLLAGGKTTKLTHWVKHVIWFSKIAHHRPAHGEIGGRQAAVGKYCCVWHSNRLEKHLWKDYWPDLFVNSIKEHKNPNIKLGW